MTAAAPTRVLFAEDNPDHAFLIRRLLKGFGLDPVHAATGDEAAEALSAWTGDPPALVLLDHGMPGKSGLELFDLALGDERFRAVPVAMFSSAPLPPRTTEELARRAETDLERPRDPEAYRPVLEAMSRHLAVVPLPFDAHRRAT